MGRGCMTCLLVAALLAAAKADVLILNDGRSFVGTVRSEGETVFIQTSNSTLSFPKSIVTSIEVKPTPEDEFAAKLADVAKTDTEALFKLAQWAAANSLPKQSQELATTIIELSADHAAARKLLGFVRIDGQWLAFDKAIESARGKLDAGQLDALRKDVLPTLEGVASGKDRLAQVKELQGLVQLRSKDFAASAKTFAALAEAAEAPAAIRFAAIAEVLKENDDGMFVLSEDYPPGLATTRASVKAGPASLCDPMVLEAALHSKARKDIDAGRKLMEAAAKIESSDAEGAKSKYAQANVSFDRADALVKDISRSHRVEICRRRITALRKDAETDSERFDKAMTKLGQQNLSPQEYQKMLMNLIHLLDNVRDDLNAVLNAGKPYPRDLVLEIKFAELDLKKTESMRKILVDELNGQK